MWIMLFTNGEVSNELFILQVVLCLLPLLRHGAARKFS